MLNGIIWFMKIHWQSFMNTVTELIFMKMGQHFVQFRGYKPFNNDYKPLREQFINGNKTIVQVLRQLLTVVGWKENGVSF